MGGGESFIVSKNVVRQIENTSNYNIYAYKLKPEALGPYGAHQRLSEVQHLIIKEERHSRTNSEITNLNKKCKGQGGRKSLKKIYLHLKKLLQREYLILSGYIFPKNETASLECKLNNFAFF